MARLGCLALADGAIVHRILDNAQKQANFKAEIAAQKKRGPGDHLSNGDVALANGQVEAAIQEYTNAIDADPESDILYSKRATAYMEQRKYKKALSDLTTAIDLDPSSAAARLKRAQLLRKTCKFAEAREDLSRVLAAKSKHKGAMKEQDTVDKTEAMLKEAQESKTNGRRKLLADVLKLSPDCPEAHIVQAQWSFEESDFAGTSASCGKILKAIPTHVSALLLRGRAYMQMGDLSLAKRHFSEALRSDPDHKDAKTNLKALKTITKHMQQGDTLFKEGEFYEAGVEYTSALHLRDLPPVIAAALWLGFCKVQVKLARDPGYEVKVCGTAYEQNPNDEEAAYYKIKAMLHNKQFDLAVRDARIAEQKFQSHALHQLFLEAAKAQAKAARKQYYEILGVAKEASASEIKRAYRDMARKFHPDKARQEGLTAETAHERFMDATEAYQVLSDPEKRTDYDDEKDLQIGRPQPGGGRGAGQRFQFPQGFQFPEGFQFPGGFQFADGFPEEFTMGGQTYRFAFMG